MKKHVYLLIFSLLMAHNVYSATLVTCPESNSCNVSIYQSSNSTIFGRHTITLVPPKDENGNNLPLSTSCNEPYLFVESRNRCETTEFECSSEGVFDPLSNTCQATNICESTGGMLDSTLGTCRKYPDCDLGGTFNPDTESMW